jgi:hypothetical protein
MTQFPILEEVISSCMAPAIALLDCGKERLFVHGITCCSVANDLVGLIIDH